MGERHSCLQGRGAKERERERGKRRRQNTGPLFITAVMSCRFEKKKENTEKQKQSQSSTRPGPRLHWQKIEKTEKKKDRSQLR